MVRGVQGVHARAAGKWDGGWHSEGKWQVAWSKRRSHVSEVMVSNKHLDTMFMVRLDG